MKIPACLLSCLVLAAAGALGAAEAVEFRRTEDVIYGRKFGTALTLDVFQPSAPNGAAVVYVISGGWFSDHRFISVDLCRPFLARGYTVFAVVHGSQPKFQIPEVMADLHRAVRFIRHHAPRYGIDPDRIGVAGGSAGGHLSLVLATSGGPGPTDAEDPVERASSAVQAVACFFPPTDFLNYGRPGESALGEGVLRDFQPAFGDVPVEPAAKEAYGRSISPRYHVRPGIPPVYLRHGDADQLVPIQQAEVFLARVREVGGTAELDVRPGGGHGWENWMADLERFADWFDRHLGGSAAR